MPATLVRSLGVGARRLKTDRRDAQVLSEVSCRIDLPSVHVPSRQARQRKTMCGMREALVGARTKVLNTVRGWLRAEGRRPRGGDRHDVRRLASERCTPRRTLPTYVERQLRAHRLAQREIADADRELAATAKADPIARRLMTVPGVGPSTSVRFVAALDEISRFRGAHTVESYLGLVPGEDSSAERQAPDEHHEGRADRRCAGVWCRPRGRRAARGGRIRCSVGPTKSRSDAARGSRFSRSRASWRGSCTRSGATGRCTSRADQARSDRGRTRRTGGGDRCPATEIALMAARAGRPRKTDCDPSTDFNLCAAEREYSIEAARRPDVRRCASTCGRVLRTVAMLDIAKAGDLRLIEEPLHTRYSDLGRQPGCVPPISTLVVALEEGLPSV